MHHLTGNVAAACRRATLSQEPQQAASLSSSTRPGRCKLPLVAHPACATGSHALAYTTAAYIP
jgi:hypothetical protein